MALWCLSACQLKPQLTSTSKCGEKKLDLKIPASYLFKLCLQV